MSRTVTIHLRDEHEEPVTWELPFGFGVEYRAIAEHFVKLYGHCGDDAADIVCDILGLVGYDASFEVVHGWELFQRVEAYVYARNVHDRASDNPLRRHPKPTWLPEPWLGPESADCSVRGGTVLSQ